MSGIKDAKKKRARRRRKRQIQRILLIIAMILILIGFLFLIRAAVHAVVNKFTGPTVTTSADKTSGSPKSKKKKSSKKNTQKKKSSEKKSSEKDTVELKTVTLSKKGKNNTDKVSLTISSTGDCTLGTDESFNYSTSLNAYYESHGADYFFQHVRSVFKKDDLSIVNMEGTLTDETAREAKPLLLKLLPNMLPSFPEVLLKQPISPTTTVMIMARRVIPTRFPHWRMPELLPSVITVSRF